MKKECIYTLFLKILLVFFRVSLNTVITDNSIITRLVQSLSHWWSFDIFARDIWTLDKQWQNSLIWEMKKRGLLYMTIRNIWVFDKVSMHELTKIAFSNENQCSDEDVWIVLRVLREKWVTPDQMQSVIPEDKEGYYILNNLGVFFWGDKEAMKKYVLGYIEKNKDPSILYEDYSKIFSSEDLREINTAIRKIWGKILGSPILSPDQTRTQMTDLYRDYSNNPRLSHVLRDIAGFWEESYSSIVPKDEIIRKLTEWQDYLTLITFAKKFGIEPAQIQQYATQLITAQIPIANSSDRSNIFSSTLALIENGTFPPEMYNAVLISMKQYNAEWLLILSPKLIHVYWPSEYTSWLLLKQEYTEIARMISILRPSMEQALNLLDMFSQSINNQGNIWVVLRYLDTLGK